MGVFDEPSLLPAIEELPKAKQIPLQVKRLAGSRGGIAYAVFPGARRIELQQPADDAGEPAIEDAESRPPCSVSMCCRISVEYWSTAAFSASPAIRLGSSDRSF